MLLSWWLTTLLWGQAKEWRNLQILKDPVATWMFQEEKSRRSFACQIWTWTSVLQTHWDKNVLKYSFSVSGNMSGSVSMGYVIWNTPHGQPFWDFPDGTYSLKSLETSPMASMLSIIEVPPGSDSWAVCWLQLSISAATEKSSSYLRRSESLTLSNRK